MKFVADDLQTNCFALHGFETVQMETGQIETTLIEAVDPLARQLLIVN